MFLLLISPELEADFETHPREAWIKSHMAELQDLAPDFAAMYALQDYRALVIRMLHRADLHGLREYDATVAFCYASIKLGVGFEDLDEHGWFATILRLPDNEWPDNIWAGLQNAIDAGFGAVQ